MSICLQFQKEIKMSLFDISLNEIKKRGLQKDENNLDYLIELFKQDLEPDIKREIVSSIGRQKNNKKIYQFIHQEAFKKHYMEVIYQMFRTCLYKAKEDKNFANLRDELLAHYDNEVMQKMFDFYNFKQNKKQKQVRNI